MERYECSVCGYIYDPVAGDPDFDVPEETTFDDLPEDWGCPRCGADMEDFFPVD